MSPLDDQESSPLKASIEHFIDGKDDYEEEVKAKVVAAEGTAAVTTPRLLFLISIAVFFGFLAANGFFNYQQKESSAVSAVGTPSIHGRSGDGETAPAKQHHAHVDTEDPRDHRPWPRLAWLMSFPNSGTSFTLYAVRVMTQMCTATNYGNEWRDKTGQSVPLFDDHPEGPYLIDGEEMAKPEGEMYVLTKTHCGGRCTTCGPDAYVENLYSFRRRCRMGFVSVYNNETKQSDRLDTIIDYDRISKIVHILRDPFDNAVSRFHLEKKKNYTEIANIPPTKKGFRHFCAFQIDRAFLGKERSHRIWDEKVWTFLQHIPCHSEFYRWVMWHNMAFVLTRDMDIPSHIIHYENYTDNYEETLYGLLDFLKAKPTGKMPDFIQGKVYRDYFSEEDIRNVALAVKELALPTTWKHIRHYFDDVKDLQ